MAWKFGNDAVSAAYLGSAEVSAAYLGNSLLWQKSGSTPTPEPGPMTEPVPGVPIALYHFEEFHTGSMDETGNFEGLFYGDVPLAKFGNTGAAAGHVRVERGEFTGVIGMAQNNVLLHRVPGEHNHIPPLGVNAFTFEFWICPRTRNTGSDIQGVGEIQLLFIDGDNSRRLYGKNSGIGIGNMPEIYEANAQERYEVYVSGGQWHHFAYVWDGSGVLSQYVDGVLKTQTTEANLAALLISGTFYQIGLNCVLIVGGSVGEELDLVMDEVALFDYVRYAGNFTPPTEPYSLTTLIQE